MRQAGGPLPALPRPCLMLVTDRSLTAGAEGLIEAVAAAVRGGVNAVQIREKDLTNEALLQVARRVRAAIGDRALLILNDRPAVALAAGADGVHGGETSLATTAMLRATRGRLLVGRSVHSLEGARAAAAAGAHYLVLGTIFPSRSHPGAETGGIERVRRVAAVAAAPVIAIGGITPANVPEVIAAGAAGVAVISAILGQPDAAAAARALRGALDDAWRGVEPPPGRQFQSVGSA